MSKKDSNESLRRVQYLGASGYTRLCLIAIDAILNSGWLPKKAIIVSKRPYGNNPTQDHLFLFVDWAHFPITVVPSGFARGRNFGGWDYGQVLVDYPDGHGYGLYMDTPFIAIEAR